MKHRNANFKSPGLDRVGSDQTDRIEMDPPRVMVNMARKRSEIYSRLVLN